MPHLGLEKAILKTLIYADIFDYPLTEEEICERLIEIKTTNDSSRSKLRGVSRHSEPRFNRGRGIIKLPEYGRSLHSPPAGGFGRDDVLTQQVARNYCFAVSLKEIKNLKLIREKEGYYFLYDRISIVKIRQKRKKYSREKLKTAQKVANLLRFIPGVKLIGITGALACNNAEKDDDIDLLIITSSGLLWTTRLLVTLFIELTGRRRRPKDKQVRDKICLNMFIDEDHLEILKKERDLFSAYEVTQMKPLFDRSGIYQKFLKVNHWVKEFLPNSLSEDIKILRHKDTKSLFEKLSFRANPPAGGGVEESSNFWNMEDPFRVRLQGEPSTLPRLWRGIGRDDERTFQTGSKRKGKDKLLFNILVSHCLSILERILKSFQLWYMRKRRTTEVTTDGVIRFHPKDARKWVLNRYNDNLQKYESGN